jgi:hypothetical protein
MIKLVRRIRHAVLLWHLPLVIFFGSWDAAVSPSDKRSVQAPLDARLAPETPELPPFSSTN